MKKRLSFIGELKYIITLSLLLFGILPIMTGCDYSKGSPSDSWNSRPYNRYQNQQRREQEETLKRLQEQRQAMENYQKMIELQERNIQPVPAQNHVGSPRSNYEELWDECEYYSELLEDNDIDHDDLSYPMDYHDLEDLKDEYESLLDENEIDY